MNSPAPSLEVDCRSVKERLDRGEAFLLLDCREADEFAFVRIEGAMHLPMSELPRRAVELEAHRAAPIVVLCHHGVRSLKVSLWLRGQGFADVRSMSGGIDAWSREIDPGLPRY